VENETETIVDLKNGRKHSKRGKGEMHTYRTWNMARKLKKLEKGKHTV
jgi:hypothetical protein